MNREPDRLPDDLARLGVYLEVAAAEAVRSRGRRAALMSFVGAVALAVPFALAVAAADLSPGDAFAPGPAPVELAVQPPTNGFLVRHIPDEPLPPRLPQRCLDAHDCRTPLHPTPSPAPAGRR
jgi:hypothetical protein